MLWETPFDLVDVYKQFHETIQGQLASQPPMTELTEGIGLESVAPQVLTVMTGQTSEAQRQSLQSIFQVAATGGEAMVKEQARLRVASHADKERPL